MIKQAGGRTHCVRPPACFPNERKKRKRFWNGERTEKRGENGQDRADGSFFSRFFKIFGKTIKKTAVLKIAAQISAAGSA